MKPRPDIRTHHGAMEAMSTRPKKELMYVHRLKLYLDEIGAMKRRIEISAVNTTTENACEVQEAKQSTGRDVGIKIPLLMLRRVHECIRIETGNGGRLTLDNRKNGFSPFVASR